MEFKIRKATIDDRPQLEQLISASVRALSRDVYDERQIELSIKSVFGVDTELISDGTYFVVETEDGTMAGCGGWSTRRTLYGSSRYLESRDSETLDPNVDSAKIRAFFVNPEFARKGVGSMILDVCERAAIAAGFRSAEMMATLPGVRLYEVRGYLAGDERRVPVGGGIDIICVKMTKNLV